MFTISCLQYEKYFYHVKTTLSLDKKILNKDCVDITTI